MIHNRSYTSVTPSDNVPAYFEVARRYSTNIRALIGWRTAWFAIFLLGVALRLLRITWQPLWWDEGYSLFFATEPLPTMLSLTAQDIHPPLYYTLLHFWFNFLGNTEPETARLLSIFIGVATLPVVTWASLTLWPRQRWLALIATLFVSISPIHIFYSQEVRMYGLALLLSLLASTFLWRLQQSLERGQRPFFLATAYVVAASLALLTLYYTGLLLLAHQLWAITTNRRNPRRLLWFFIPAALILLAQLPWWSYALPKLFTYVVDKVQADQDQLLPIWTYLWRHWLAFFTGHVVSPLLALEIARHLLAALIAFLLGYAATIIKLNDELPGARWLIALILTPLLVGFAVNVRLPFFPEGGERLLLQLLPYVLLLQTLIIGKLYTVRPRLALAALLLPCLAALLGNVIYFTTPRYAEHDYRPIIANIITQSRHDDTVLALFPWQVGYWRAYSPRGDDGTLLPPQPAPVDQTVLTWDAAFEARLETALQRGTLWFPMPLSFGSTLPAEIESYLMTHARNLENLWYSPATRLSAWVRTGDELEQMPVEISFQDQVHLVSTGVAPQQIAAANEPLAIDLCWQPPQERADLRATLRLVSSSGYIWAKRDLTPLAAFASIDLDQPCLEAIAMNIPAGIPLDTYQLAVGVGPAQGDNLLPATSITSPLIGIATITVTAPSETLSEYRLPIEHRLSAPTSDAGLLLLGYTGPEQGDRLLAGDAVALTLFLQNITAQPVERNLFVSLVDSHGNGVAGWQGWPFPNYPTNAWSLGALTQVPIHFFLPPDMRPGRYSLISGFLDPTSGEKRGIATFTEVQVTRRPNAFTPATMPYVVAPDTTFGTHAMLAGYDIVQENASLNVDLTWQVLQPILPSHHIFVHVTDATGERIAQSDGEPLTEDGRAPTGSWLTGEYLTTRHTLTLPPAAQPPYTIQVGLYEPTAGARLPVTVDGSIVGDSATITFPAPP